MLQKKAGAKIPSGAHVGRSQFPEREVCHCQKSPRPTHQRHQLWAQPQKNPSHVKASEARQLLGPLRASRTQAGRQSPRKQDLSSFTLGKTKQNKTAPNCSVLGRVTLHSLRARGLVKAAERPPGGGWWKLTCSVCLWVQPLGKCCKDHQALQEIEPAVCKRSNVSRPPSGDQS